MLRVAILEGNGLPVDEALEEEAEIGGQVTMTFLTQVHRFFTR